MVKNYQSKIQDSAFHWDTGSSIIANILLKGLSQISESVLFCEMEFYIYLTYNFQHSR